MSKSLQDPEWPKDCSCGTVFTPEEWEQLKLVGVQKSSYDDIPSLEMRLCPKCMNVMAQIEPSDIHFVVRKGSK